MMITQEELKKRVHYDPETGVFSWLNGLRKGKPAGSKNRRGYLQIRPSINEKRQNYEGQRLAWLYVYGQWPFRIDHINCDPYDNRLCNLRLATASQNGMNSHRRSDATGLRGTTWNYRKNKWQAQIRTTIDGKRRQYFLGYFAIRQEAAAAYAAASRFLHREFSRTA